VEEIARFISRGSPRFAIVFAREAQAAAHSLTRFALRGRLVPERDDERLRELLLLKSYRLIYRVVSGDEIHVIAVIHGARDLDAFLARQKR